KAMAGIKLIHVPYRSGYVADVLSGQVQVVFGSISTCVQYIRGGRVRALAVTTANRLDVLPEIPTLDEFVPGYEASAWYGLGAPKDTPAEVIDKLNKAMNAVLADPKSQARFTELGASTLPGSPADFGRLLADETEKWGKVVKVAGITPV